MHCECWTKQPAGSLGQPQYLWTRQSCVWWRKWAADRHSSAKTPIFAVFQRISHAEWVRNQTSPEPILILEAPTSSAWSVQALVRMIWRTHILSRALFASRHWCIIDVGLVNSLPLCLGAKTYGQSSFAELSLAKLENEFTILTTNDKKGWLIQLSIWAHFGGIFYENIEQTRGLSWAKLSHG